MRCLSGCVLGKCLRWPAVVNAISSHLHCLPPAPQPPPLSLGPAARKSSAGPPHALQQAKTCRQPTTVQAHFLMPCHFEAAFGEGPPTSTSTCGGCLQAPAAGSSGSAGSQQSNPHGNVAEPMQTDVSPADRASALGPAAPPACSGAAASEAASSSHAQSQPQMTPVAQQVGLPCCFGSQC